MTEKNLIYRKKEYKLHTFILAKKLGVSLSFIAIDLSTSKDVAADQ